LETNSKNEELSKPTKQGLPHCMFLVALLSVSYGYFASFNFTDILL